MRFYLTVLIALLFAIESQAATGDQSAPHGVESIGGRLLDDLSPDAGAPTAPPRTAKKKSRETIEIENSLKASTPLNGFGVGANPTSHPLVRVRHDMQYAQSLLAPPEPDAKSSTTRVAGPVQQEILSDLDKLIADLSKQCQCCSQCQGGQCNQPPKPGQNPKPGKPNAAGRGRTAARDSTDRLESTTAKPVDKGEVNEMVKAIWGNLPERSREQMLQSFSDEFLPKYELEIEQYYRRLSEEQGKSQPE